MPILRRLTLARLSSSARAADANLEVAETTWEVSYLIQLRSDFFLQPDFQYVQNPSADANITNTSVFTLRCQVAL